MSIPQTVSKYLDEHTSEYKVIAHPYTATSSHTAQAAHVTGERIAKGVLLADEKGYMLAVLPATHTLQVNRVREITGRDIDIAPEAKLADVFPDCALGAVPSIGPAYGVETIVDDALFSHPEIFFEAGDHEHLVRLGEQRFERLMGDAKHFVFSAHKH